MSSKIDNLTKKIYTEGVEKAKNEAKTIIAEAEKKAESILDEAKKNADKIIEKEKKTSEDLKGKVMMEMQMASENLIETLKQKITDLIVVETLEKSLSKTFDDADYLKSIITSIAEKWDPNSRVINDLTLLLPKEKEKDFTDAFKKNVFKLLNQKLEVKFENDFKDGFVIQPSDGSYKMSFTKTDFINFFKYFLNPEVRKILFKEESQ